MTTKILALDDEPTILALYQSILEPAGYQITLTSNGLEALDMLRTQYFDLLIQDFQRPEFDGCKMLKWLRSSPTVGEMPVLLVSADTRQERCEELELEGLDWDRDLQGYLEKPFSASALLDMVEAILQKYDKPLPPKEMRVKEKDWWLNAGS